MLTVRIGPEPFDLAAELALLTAGRTDVGGLGAFIGIVRANTAGANPLDAPLVAMTLEHYPAMTERAVRAIAETALARWSLLGVTVVHRVGRLALGEPIVLVLAAAAHRAAALDATSFLIDWLKTRAPFWKQEHFADGTTRWVDARTEDDLTAARWDPRLDKRA